MSTVFDSVSVGTSVRPVVTLGVSEGRNEWFRSKPSQKTPLYYKTGSLNLLLFSVPDGMTLLRKPVGVRNETFGRGIDSSPKTGGEV